MLKVLCFGRFFDEIPGGMQTHVEHLFESLRGEVEFVHLVPSRDSRGHVGSVRGFSLIRTPSWNVDGSLALSPSLISAARRLHQQHRFDLVHLHLPDPMSHLASMAIPSRVPRVLTWHADITRQKLLRVLYGPWQSRLLKQSKAIIAATPSHISSSGPLSAMQSDAQQARKLHVIPFGFDLAHYTQPQALTERLRLQYPGTRIFALGRHVYYKGFDVLIRAMAGLPADTQLIIGGDGPLTAEWKALAAQSPAASRIHFAGLIPSADLPAYFQACDIFCLPAVNQAEAFGIVQVEAMACGKPVVSSRLNNGVDFVNQDGVTGYTTLPSDVGALAQALNRLIAEPDLRARLGEQARERAQTEFSLAALRGKTLAAYREALAA
jgi:glycosyltransferase involved in cell wall biosynthesis